eukprot:4739638-Pyramimonas_sp.AAC.1
MAYWPPFTEETATATCWLALDDSTRANGCMRFIPGERVNQDWKVQDFPIATHLLCKVLPTHLNLHQACKTVFRPHHAENTTRP